ncbi:MAG: hypothetical protein ABIH23_12685, partial [bacterium]
RAKVANVVANMRSAGIALETYFLDHNCYPPSWAREDNDYAGYRHLTSPVAYVQGYSVLTNTFFPKHEELLSHTEYDHYFELGVWKYTGGGIYEPLPLTTVWLLEGWGPRSTDPYDSKYFPQVPSKAVFYPTNGLRSKGGFFRAGGAHLPDWSKHIPSYYYPETNGPFIKSFAPFLTE